MTSPASAAATLRRQYKAAEPPYAAFTGPKGRAWLVQGDDAPTGWVEQDGQTQEYADLDAWQQAVEAAGITTPDDPAAPPAPAADTAEPGPEVEDDAAALPLDEAPAPRPVLPSLRQAVEDVTADVPVAADPAPAADKDDPKPEAKGKPAGIGVGSWVSWGSNVGRVDLLVTSGTVPGVDDDTTATTAKPLARVVEWGDGEWTKTKHAVPVADLSTTPPRTGQKTMHDTTLADVTQAAAAAGVPAEAVQEAYARGVKSWPGVQVTEVKAVDWAAGRAARLVQAAHDPHVPCNDRDLLP